MNTNFLTISKSFWCAMLMALCTPIACLAGEVVPLDCSDCFACDGGATVTTEEPGELTYRWINNQGDEIFQEVNDLGTSSVENLCQGIYYVAISENNTTLETYSFNVAVVGTDPGDNTEIFICTSSSTFDLLTTIEGTPMPGGSWSDNSGTPATDIFTPDAAGSQTLIYTLDAGACDVMSELVVNTNEPAYPGNSTTYDICDHYDPFELFDVLNENPEPNGEWLNTEGEVFDGVFVPGVDPSGQYIYRIDTVPGCPPVYSNVNMDVHEYPNAGLDTNLIVCSEADEIDLANFLTDDADEDGVWKDPANQTIASTINPDTAPAGNYKYIVTGTTPCPTVSSTFEVEIDTLVTAGNDTDASLCEGSNTVDLTSLLDGMPDDYGVWTDSSGEEVSPFFDPLTDSPQTFQYAVEAIGCTAEIAMLDLTLDEMPEAGEDSTFVICESSESIDLNQYLSNDAWSGGGWFQNGDELVNGQSLEVVPGNLAVSYIALNGSCPPDSAYFNIQVDELPGSISDQQLEMCNSDDEIVLADELQIGSLNLEFFNSQTGDEVTSFDPSVNNGSDYFYVSYSSNICPNDTANLAISVLEKVFADTVISASVCESVEVVNLQDFLQDGMPTNGVWTDVSEPVNQDQLIDSPGDFEFTYSVENGSVCDNSVLTLQLHVSDQLEAGGDSSIALCETDAPVYLETFLSDEASMDGSWWVDETEMKSSQWDPLSMGSGAVSYVVHSEEPCPVSIADIQIVVDDEVDVTMPDGFEACANAGAQQIEVQTSGDYDFEWEETPLLSSLSVANPWINYNQLPNESYSEYLSVQIQNGACQKLDSILVEVSPYPIVQLTGDPTICEGEIIQFEATGANNYSWAGIPSGFEVDSTSIAGVAVEDFEIELTGTNDFGCVGMDQQLVTVLDTPEVDLNLSAEDGCAPVTLELLFESQQEIVSYYWQLNGDFLYEENGDFLELNDPGQHFLELNATASNGCSAHVEAEDPFEVYENPTADFLFEEESVDPIKSQVSILNTSSAADSYFWNFGELGTSVDENPTLYFAEQDPGFYEACLTAETDFGCVDTVCKTIELEGAFSIYIPNAFTPNGDGHNEVFKPVMQGVDPADYLLVIYNRWGEKIFESNDPNQAWIGNVNGGNHYAPPAVYNWQLKVKNRYTGEIEKLSGHISVLR